MVVDFAESSAVKFKFRHWCGQFDFPERRPFNIDRTQYLYFEVSGTGAWDESHPLPRVWMIVSIHILFIISVH